MTHSIPDEVRRFVLTSVASVPYLEALLLLRSEPDRGWASHQVAARLYIPESKAAELLATLVQGGIAAPRADGSGLFDYRPTPELGAVLDQVASSYSANLVGITDLIHSRIDKRAQQFADAFKIKRREG